MTNISSFPSNYANAVTPYVPLGRQPVSQESSDLKTSSFKALEQAAASARGENRPPSEKLSVGDKPEGRQQRGLPAQLQEEQERVKAEQKEQLIKDQAEIAELSARDREVRSHEQAHAAVGGQYASAPTYEFVKGPDGLNYAVSGEVAISAGAVPNDPEATIAKAQQIRAAANAPAEPSGQDRAVAAVAANMEAAARAELNEKRSNEIREQEMQQQDDLTLRKAEQAEKAEDAEQLREQERKQQIEKEQREALAAEEERAAERRIERMESVNELNTKTFDINRHLIDIGAVSGSGGKGTLLNQQV